MKKILTAILIILIKLQASELNFHELISDLEEKEKIIATQSIEIIKEQEKLFYPDPVIGDCHFGKNKQTVQEFQKKLKLHRNSFLRLCNAFTQGREIHKCKHILEAIANIDAEIYENLDFIEQCKKLILTDMCDDEISQIIQAFAKIDKSFHSEFANFCNAIEYNKLKPHLRTSAIYGLAFVDRSFYENQNFIEVCKILLNVDRCFSEIPYAIRIICNLQADFFNERLVFNCKQNLDHAEITPMVKANAIRKLCN